MNRRLLPWAGLLLLLLLTVGIYWPGTHGDFLFDDFINLPALGATGPIRNMAAFWRYVTSGTADPTGRPLALLSFLIDARNWPAPAFAFLRTNIFIHALNGSILFLLLRQLGRSIDTDKLRADVAALVGSGAWLLHPLFVSTTLYVVQREAMLSTTFVLAGLVAWWHGRTLAATGRAHGTAWMVTGIIAGTVLATLCKANGILLPLLAWVIDRFLPAAANSNAAVQMDSAATRRLRMLLLVVPSLLVIAYVASFAVFPPENHAGRSWTQLQRLLTEPRVICDYLRLLWMPRVLSTGLFNDGYPASTSLFAPATTLPAILVLAAVAIGTWRLRHRWPVACTAMAFFLAGHLLESTVIPLELYFEHRNYLPAALMFWPLGFAIARWRVSVEVRAAVAVALLAVLGLTTAQRIDIWRQPALQAQLWAHVNPGSARAQATAAIWEIRSGHPDKAEKRLDAALARKPDELQFALNLVDARCSTGGLGADDAARVETAIRLASQGDQLLFQWLEKSIAVAQSGGCPGLALGTIETWLAAAGKNKRTARSPTHQQNVQDLLGQVALVKGDADEALAHFNLAIDALPTPGAAGKQTALLAAAGHYHQALSQLDHYEEAKAHAPRPGLGMIRAHAWVLARQHYWDREFAILRGKIEDELRKAPSDDPVGTTGQVAPTAPGN